VESICEYNLAQARSQKGHFPLESQEKNRRCSNAKANIVIRDDERLKESFLRHLGSL
jgi:hypothetical protein